MPRPLRRLSAHRRVGLALAAAVSACVVAGCKSGGSAAGADDLPSNRKAALMQGDRLISEGEELKEQGVKLKRDGKDKEGDDLIARGEQKMIDGEKAKRDGMMMKN